MDGAELLLLNLITVLSFVLYLVFGVFASLDSFNTISYMKENKMERVDCAAILNVKACCEARYIIYSCGRSEAQLLHFCASLFFFNCRIQSLTVSCMLEKGIVKNPI
jgi:hypothetical protein